MSKPFYGRVPIETAERNHASAQRAQRVMAFAVGFTFGVITMLIIVLTDL